MKRLKAKQAAQAEAKAAHEDRAGALLTCVGRRVPLLTTSRLRFFFGGEINLLWVQVFLG